MKLHSIILFVAVKNCTVTQHAAILPMGLPTPEQEPKSTGPRDIWLAYVGQTVC